MPGPVPGPNDVLIRVRKTSICGTDLHIYRLGRLGAGHDPRADGRRPRVHGRDRRDRWRGRRPRTSATGSPARATSPAVTAATAGPGGATLPQPRRRRRQPAGGVRRVRRAVPAANVFPLPDHIDDDVAAILDPLGNATHTALQLRPGRRGRARSPAPARSVSWRWRSPATSAPATSSSPTSTGTGSTLAARLGATARGRRLGRRPARQ